MKKFTMYIGRYSCSCCSNDSKRQVCTNDQDYAIRNAKRHHYHHQWCPYVSQLCETFQNEEEAYRNCVLSWEKNGLHYFTYTNSTRIYYDNTKNLFEVSFFSRISRWVEVSNFEYKMSIYFFAQNYLKVCMRNKKAIWN